MAVFEIEDLTYYYPGTDRPAISGLNLNIEEGEFIVLTGPSGSGKTTLARAIGGLVPNFFGGKIGGKVSYKGQSISNLDRRKIHREIGVVTESPEKQLIMSTVERELAFGPENLGMEPERIKRRIMETASSLGISDCLDFQTEELSGGMKQRVVLGAVMAMEPRVLVLDEPTSQLDPVAAKELLELLKRLRDELGYTIFLVEQKIESCLPVADRVLFLDSGRLAFNGPPTGFCLWTKDRCPEFLPPVTRLFADSGHDHLPMAVSEGRRLLRVKSGPVFKQPRRDLPDGEELAELKSVSFNYDNGKRALRRLNLTVRRGEILAVLGPNGAGKTTLLKVITGLLRPSAGTSSVDKKDLFNRSNHEKAALCGYLSQNPDDFLFHESVSEEVGYKLSNLGRDYNQLVDESLRHWRITELALKNPRELSAGEKQCVALAAATIADPPLLLLDEPTRGLDPLQRDQLGARLTDFVKKANAAAVIVTQDIEFAAEWAGRVVLLFNGELVAQGTVAEIFKGDPFYSSQISRLFHNIADGIVTVADARKALS